MNHQDEEHSSEELPAQCEVEVLPSYPAYYALGIFVLSCLCAAGVLLYQSLTWFESGSWPGLSLIELVDWISVPLLIGLPYNWHLAGSWISGFLELVPLSLGIIALGYFAAVWVEQKEWE